MIVFPNAKINLGLHITGKREDGYHNLETVFYPLPVRDALEIIFNSEINQAENPRFTSSGLDIPGDPADNICVRAYRLLKHDFPNLPAAHIHLHKAIPMGAGLGGGSSDGAYTLTLLNRMAGLDLTEAQLIRYALALGSDCPFFIRNKPCFAQGRGEIMEPVSVDLNGCSIVLIYPGIHVSTADAFRAIHPQKSQVPIREIVTEPLESWPQRLKNDFERPVFEKFPAIAELKDALYESGAIYASMTGSGAAVFGIFRGAPGLQMVFPKEYRVFHCPLDPTGNS